MKITRIAQVSAIGAAAALVLAGCASNEPAATEPATTESGSSAPASTDVQLEGTLSGAGASSQKSAMTAWVAGIQTANNGLTVEYNPTGSGAGRTAFQEGGTAFAGSDRAFKSDELSETFASCVAGTDLVELPTYISPIALVFKLDGIESLNMDAATIASIFTGKITKWNDAKIAEQNAGVSLPDLAIAAVHRSDKSGTTGNFTDYLSAAASDIWTDGSVEEWPAAYAGEAAQGTSGVVSAVEGAVGAIGYVDASRAAGFGTVSVKVGEEYVAYTPEAAAAVVDASELESGRAATDLAVKLDRTTTAAGVYPIVLVSYLIGCSEYQDAKTAALVKGFFSYVASKEAQDAAAKEAGSAPISEELRTKINAAIDVIK